MKLRRSAALLLAVALLLCCAAPTLAQSDKEFIRQLKKLDGYLRAYEDAADLGENALRYVLESKEMKGLNYERLEFVLRVYLGCGATVRMSTRFAAYAKDIANGYDSLSDLCARGYTPEQAAEEGCYARKYAGAGFGKINAPKGYKPPDPPSLPVCCP